MKKIICISFLICTAFLSSNIFAAEHTLPTTNADMQIPSIDSSLFIESESILIPLVHATPITGDELDGAPHADAIPIIDDVYIEETDSINNENQAEQIQSVSDLYTLSMAIGAAKENREPNYIPIICLLNDRVEAWLDKIDVKNLTRAGRAYQSINAALKSASDLAELAASNALARLTKDKSRKIDDSSSSTKSAHALSAAWDAGWGSAWLGSSSSKLEEAFEDNWSAATEYPIANDWVCEVEEQAFVIAQNMAMIGLSKEITRSTAYRIAERATLILLYENLIEVLDDAYYMQNNQWKISGSKFKKIFKKLEKYKGTTAVLLTPFTQVLQKRVNALSELEVR